MGHQNVNTQDHGDARDQRTQHEGSPSAEKKSNRGFASMDPAKQREIASKGGRAAHEKGTAHQFSANEAREAGRKGGGTVSQNRAHMAQIGRIGGQARGRKQRASTAPAEHTEHVENEGEVKNEAKAGGANVGETRH